MVGPSQHVLIVYGYFNATIQNGNSTTSEPVYVIEGLRSALAGRPTIQKLKLLSAINSVTKTKEDIVSQFPELFTGLGCIRGSYQIELEDGTESYSVSTPRRVPIPLLPKVKCELERMEREGVISRINESTDWCSGMVVVPKPNGRVRICVDLTKLNHHVRRERHILPSVDHVLAQIGHAKYFSKLDANSGFWQIELSPISSKLTTCITPFGRFMFNRLPFGISSAPEFFQKKMSEILRDCEGVVGLIDDLLIYRRTEEEHQRCLLAVLEKLRKEGVTINEDKCKFYTSEILFLGHVLNRNGVSPDPEKTNAIRNIPNLQMSLKLEDFLVC